MPDELHPADAELLSLDRDAATGVDYIATGKSPYHLDYRRSLFRTLRAAERANDLRVYADGDLSVGVRSGRCFIAEAGVSFPGETGLALTPNTTTHLWLDDTATVQSSPSGLPADRATFIPLATVVTGGDAIESLTDLRGETFLQAAGPAALGLTVTAAEINQALSGINPGVTNTALNKLTAGPLDAADVYHTHAALMQDVAEEAFFVLANDRDDPAADLCLRFSLPQRLPFDTVLKPHADHHFLQQSYGPTTHTLVGSTTVSFTHAENFTASVADQLMGPVPLAGRIVAVVMSVGGNLQSSDDADGLTVAVKVNGNTATQTPASLTAADGPGFASTDQADGSPATLKTDGSATVARGDLVTLDLTRAVNGTVSNEASNVGVIVVIRADRPE